MFKNTKSDPATIKVHHLFSRVCMTNFLLIYPTNIIYEFQIFLKLTRDFSHWHFFPGLIYFLNN